MNYPLYPHYDTVLRCNKDLYYTVYRSLTVTGTNLIKINYKRDLV